MCELWSGNSIIRTIGATTLKDLLIDEKGELFDLRTAFSNPDEDSRPLNCDALACIESDDDKTDFLRTIAAGPANLTLNLKRFAARKWEMCLALLTGALLQAGDLIYASLTTYHWPWGLKSKYACPCFWVGSVLVVGGLTICGKIIESVTTEHEFYQNANETCQHRIIKVIRIQKSGHVGEQHFDSYAITTPVTENLVLRTSRRNEEKYRYEIELQAHHKVAYTRTVLTSDQRSRHCCGICNSHRFHHTVHWTQGLALVLHLCPHNYDHPHDWRAGTSPSWIDIQNSL